MATAVSEPKVPKQKTAPGDEIETQAGFLAAYKPGEGYATRLGAFVVAILFILFTCHHWYYGWTFVRDIVYDVLNVVSLGVLVRWTTNLDTQRLISLLGAILLFIAGGIWSYRLIYVKAKTSEFLVKTDGELAKVTWPRITPWFKADTPVWGSTYVVLIVVAALTVYVFGVDFIFGLLAKISFYGSSE